MEKEIEITDLFSRISDILENHQSVILALNEQLKQLRTVIDQNDDRLAVVETLLNFDNYGEEN